MSQDLPGDTFVGPRFGMWRPTQCVRHGQADEGRRSHRQGHREVPRGEPGDVVSLPHRGRRCLIGKVEVRPASSAASAVSGLVDRLALMRPRATATRMGGAAGIQKDDM